MENLSIEELKTTNGGDILA